MNGPRCPFCGLDPYEYVDIGVGYKAVGVSCCDFGIEFFDWRIDSPRVERIGLLLLGDQRRARRGRRLMKRLEAEIEDES